MINIFVHPNSVVYEPEWNCLTFKREGFGEAIVYLAELPKGTQEFLKAAGQINNVVATVHEDVAGKKRTVKIVIDEENLRADNSSQDL